MLDERLALAAELFQPCELGADVGTDHGLLPCHLLEEGVCERMLLSDISAQALERAQTETLRRELSDRVMLLRADGLTTLHGECGCISIMGMGGQTIAHILRQGIHILQDGCVLVLSAHTEQAEVRRAIYELGWHFTAERLAKAAGRFYIVWRAEEGAVPLTPGEVRRGSLVYQQEDPLLRPYLDWRIQVLETKRQGLRSAASLSTAEARQLADTEEDLGFFIRVREALQ